MEQAHQSPNLSNPFENLSEEIIFNILDCLDEDPQTKKSFSLVNKSFHSTESIHRRSLRPLRTNLLPSTLRRYRYLSHLDFTCCPRVEDDALVAIADVYKTSLRAIDLRGLGSLVTLGCQVWLGNVQVCWRWICPMQQS